MISPEKTESFVQMLLAWAKNNTRDFPWRKTKNPYKILIAEIMLQRTNAKQVAPVYERFIKKYPDVDSLSRASVSEIRERIISLGLKKRAQGLNTLARQLVEEYKGKIPNNKDGLLELHWVGNYIANAILCHAFGEDVPTVDGNFARVLIRVFSIKPKAPAQKDKRIWVLAQSLMPLVKGRGCTLNLAVLDIASEICTPRKPLCGVCPLNSICDYGALVLS